MTTNPNASAGRKNQFQARLDNQKAQLERHGNFAEVVIRTTPEATDMINFARLWEHVLIMGDRSTRGYMAKTSREDFDKTREGFVKSVDFMVKEIQAAVDRHDIDLSGNNFISRVAQRYKIVDRKKKNDEKGDGAKPRRAAAKPAEKPSLADTDQVDNL